ncbi:hypothetical protein [Shimazuella alba]|uniref:Uncharacterized protein n=1 Tax=Shimazuella alba TaxID=2690964 RepID=A0A6I4VT36_9BACL|nr:hypothetical protein [Shimazuella alba]MXQ53638.1 hypothetical protein [Shimazuella alba]
MKKSINVEQFKKAASNSELLKTNIVSSAIIENSGADLNENLFQMVSFLFSRILHWK